MSRMRSGSNSEGITESERPLTLTGRVRSFGYAFNGIYVLVISQHNAWIHLAVTVAVLVIGGLTGLSITEWSLIVLAIASVWTAEALNTAIEFLTDLTSPDIHPLAAKAKDVAAGGVLIAAIGSAAVGLLIFVPHLLSILKGKY